MDYRLVSTSTTILRLIFDKSLNVNEIIRQTSPDRTHVISVIKALERAQLITQNKDKKHRQKKMKMLTELGHELADILVSLEKFKTAYFELRKEVNEYFGKLESIDLTVRRNILREKGLTNQDIDWYNDSKIGTTSIMAAFEGNVIEIIIVRCAMRLYKYSLSDIAKAILNNIIADAGAFLLSITLEDIGKCYPLSNAGLNKEIDVDVNMYQDVTEYLMEDIFAQNYFPNVLYKKVRNAIGSYLCLLKPPGEVVEEYVSAIDHNMEIRQKHSVEELMNDEHLRHLPERTKCVIDAYTEYINNLT